MAWGDEAAPLPVSEYHRRAHLIADLEIVLAKLIAEAHSEALEMDAEVDAQHAMAGMWQQNDADTVEMLESVHAEALEMDAQRDIDAIVESGGDIQTQIDFYAMTLLSQRAAVIADARAEAIAANEGLDFNIRALRGVIADIRKEGLSARKASENVHVVCEGVFRYVNEVLGVCLSKRGFARMVVNE